MRMRTSLELNVRCLRLLHPWPWLCLSWWQLRCSMPWTGYTFDLILIYCYTEVVASLNHYCISVRFYNKGNITSILMVEILSHSLFLLSFPVVCLRTSLLCVCLHGVMAGWCPPWPSPCPSTLWSSMWTPCLYELLFTFETCPLTVTVH